MTFWRAIRPHPAIAKPVAALAIAVWLLVGSVAYLVIQQRQTAERVVRLEEFERSCLGPAADVPKCDQLYDSLIQALSVDQLRRLNERLSSAAVAR